jgi:hypothetical protein
VTFRDVSPEKYSIFADILLFTQGAQYSYHTVLKPVYSNISHQTKVVAANPNEPATSAAAAAPHYE